MYFELAEREKIRTIEKYFSDNKKRQKMLDYHVLNYFENACVYWKSQCASGEEGAEPKTFVDFESEIDQKKDRIIRQIYELNLEDIASVKVSQIMEDISAFENLLNKQDEKTQNIEEVLEKVELTKIDE